MAIGVLVLGTATGTSVSCNARGVPAGFWAWATVGIWANGRLGTIGVSMEGVGVGLTVSSRSCSGVALGRSKIAAARLAWRAPASRWC